MKREQGKESRGSDRPCISALRNSFRAILISSFLVTVPNVPLNAAEKIEVSNIRYWSSQGYTRVVVDLSQPVEFTKKRLSNPDRLYFDLKNCRIPREIQNKLSVGDGILKSVRAGQYEPNTVRIVLDLETMEDFSAYIMDNPTKLVIDVNAKREKRIAITRRILVLDPGHGGHDSGAVGKQGLQEKDVVLDIALKVREVLTGEQEIEVVLTRDRDIFIPLPDRSLVALQHNADLFVSIHANASPDRNTRGIETYLQNWTNEEEATKVAARENYVSVRKMKEMLAQYKNDDYVGRMLNDLKRDYKRDKSLDLANYVQSSLCSDVAKVNKKTANLGVKHALFFVLMGASMPPSILAEVSFISNPEEEKLLATDAYRMVLAKSIAAGIKTYFSSSAPVQKVADLKQKEQGGPEGPGRRAHIQAKPSRASFAGR